MNLEECLVFWRSSFKKITDDTFNKDYRYNVRHAYGDVGGDGNRRGNGYSPFSCQKILTGHTPGPGEAHGCPYRHFSVDNLTALLQQVGVKDHEVLRGVKEDKEKTKYHLACNRYVLIPLYLSGADLDIGFSTMSTSRKSRKSRMMALGRVHSWKRLYIRMSTSREVTCSRTLARIP